jgi:hypothetical protein
VLGASRMLMKILEWKWLRDIEIILFGPSEKVVLHITVRYTQ